LGPCDRLRALARGVSGVLQVLAGALKDNGRARIIGENTFGKGLIQTLVPLSGQCQADTYRPDTACER
jgi:hypothetical protein